MQMDSNYKPSESDVKTVMEAHGLLTEGTLLDEALGLTSLYADIIRQVLDEVADSLDRKKAVLAVIEEGLMQEGIIPDWHEKRFEMAFLEERLKREGITLPFDPYPFIFLNLVLSCLAAVQAPIIMMSQNRQAARDRLRAEYDYRVNLKAELEVRHLHEKVDLWHVNQWKRLLEIQKIQMELIEEATHKVRSKH